MNASAGLGSSIPGTSGWDSNTDASGWASASGAWASALGPWGSATEGSGAQDGWGDAQDHSNWNAPVVSSPVEPWWYGDPRALLVKDDDEVSLPGSPQYWKTDVDSFDDIWYSYDDKWDLE
uniref:Uncharacterized protein n=1 Tax=Mycena chlorophos TaxID=658473 RepID=A0ABQ0LP52_MYCCL|nr:predicted protein [Mycena chlorophos]